MERQSAIETRDQVPRPSDAAVPGADTEHALVPNWVAAAVLAALLALGVAGGFALGRVVDEWQAPETARQDELERLRDAIRVNADDVAARLALGQVLQSNGDYDGALEQYQAVLKIDPAATGAMYNMAIIYRDRGLPDEAEKRLKQALQIDSDHVPAAVALGRLYVARDDYRSLVRVTRPVAEAHPDSADLQYLLGLGYERLGEYAAAIEAYKAALRSYPDMQEARAGLKRIEGGR